MDKFDRMQRLHLILKTRRQPVSLKSLAEELECVERTVRRAIDNLRDYYLAPIEYIPGRGWLYNDPSDTFDLSGIWFTSEELVGLASLLSIVDDMDSKLLNKELEAIRRMVDKLLVNQSLPLDLFKDKVKIIPSIKHNLDNHILEQLSHGLMQERRVVMSYQSYKGARTKRETSPLKLVYYREAWYLDAYCHLREGLRTFRLSRIHNVQVINKKYRHVDHDQQQAHFETSYGIFAGQAKRKAVLRFYGDSAREAALTKWHPNQIEVWDSDAYILTVPFKDDRELIRDILKYGADVEVVSPATLKKKVTNIAASILGLYTGQRIRF